MRRERRASAHGGDGDEEERGKNSLFSLPLSPNPNNNNHRDQVVSSRREADELKELLAIAREAGVPLTLDDFKLEKVLGKGSDTRVVK